MSHLTGLYLIDVSANFLSDDRQAFSHKKNKR